MKQWQQVIYNAVKPAAIEMARSLKKQYPQAGVSLNFNLQWPQGFKSGENASIPITLPSAQGALQIANAIIEIDNNNKIMGVGIEAMEGSIGLYDPTSRQTNVQTITGTMDRVSDFLGDVNKVMSSNAMQALLIPRISGTYSGFGLPGAGTIKAGYVPGTMRSLGSGFGTMAPTPGKARPWNQVRDSVLSAEIARAKNIKTPDSQAEFLEQSLKSPSKAPHWYYMLGGQTKEKMKEKIKKSYIDKCEEVNKTIPPTLFFQKLTEGMLQRNQISHYCEKDSDFVDGNLNNQCEQRTCPIYDPNCKKLSTRLNIAN